jgi:RNA polymerase sigma-70 factor (ECF subfamily)
METKQPLVDASTLAKLAQERSAFVAFARKRAPSADADDLVQQAFTRAQEKLHLLRDAKNAKAWFYRILRRLIADHFARQAARAGHLEKFAAALQQTPDEDLAVCACALGLMPQLKDSYREIIEKVDLEDQALAETANSLHISRNNATVRLHRARSVLRDRLKAYCGVTNASACRQCTCGRTAAR